jgi:7,8-dihydropterin-6-yl-methyl-4-(beta-D-ribofuranosyl)aminobenzene 5'-phosphate synthase
VSYLIEFNKRRILFDTGQSDMFIKNAATMNADLGRIDMIVLSHGHFDHGNGLEHLDGGTLICHPGCFVKRYRRFDNTYIGLKKTKDDLSNKFKLTTSAKPIKISDSIVFLGEIPRITDFESQTTTFMLDDGTPDLVMDDSAIALLHDKGLFVVTGCGHAGIVNTLEHARKITGIQKLFGIMGGFHLREIDHQTKKTIEYLKKNLAEHVLPSHCNSGPALTAFYESFGTRQIKTGDKIEF